MLKRRPENDILGFRDVAGVAQTKTLIYTTMGFPGAQEGFLKGEKGGAL